MTIKASTLRFFVREMYIFLDIMEIILLSQGSMTSDVSGSTHLKFEHL